MSSGEYVTLDFDELKRYTAAAYLFVIEGGEYWIPRSLVLEVDDVNDTVTVEEWKAKDLGLA